MTVVDADRHTSARSFASFMYVIGGLYTLGVAVFVLAFDDFLSRSWADWTRSSPYGFTPVTVSCAVAAISLFFAAGLSPRWPRGAAMLAAAVWVIGLLSPLLLPYWQHAHGLVGTSILVPFIGIWLVAALPVGAAIVYGLMSIPRRSNGASA